MSKMITVTLAVPRTGPAGAQGRGDKIEVSVGEAKRMRDAGQVFPFEGDAAKVVADLEAAEKAAAEKAEKAKAAKAPAKSGKAETATAGKASAETAD